MKLGNPGTRCIGTMGSPFEVRGRSPQEQCEPDWHLVFKLTKVWVADTVQCSSELLREVWEELKLWRGPGTRAVTGHCCGHSGASSLALSAGHSPQKPHDQQDQPV